MVLTVLVSLCRLKVFEASDFGSHPLFSVTQGGVDLQQVSMAAWGARVKGHCIICQHGAVTPALKDTNSHTENGLNDSVS